MGCKHVVGLLGANFDFRVEPVTPRSDAHRVIRGVAAIWQPFGWKQYCLRHRIGASVDAK